MAGRAGYGFIGYGISMYPPTCAHACRDSISNPLDCGDDGSMHHVHGMVRRMDMGHMPSPECYATNDAYLETLAYCISTHCQDVEAWRLEKYWERNVPGRLEYQPEPKETYQEALAKVTTPPNSTTPLDQTLLFVSLVDEETYLATFNAKDAFEINENAHSRYG